VPLPVPKFDDRTAREISAEVRALLASAGWPEHDQKTEGEKALQALIQVFARFSEIIIHRLNQAPEKNMLAFLDLLGVSPLPMQASRVPLTFLLAPGGAACARVPAGTQVAAPPGAGQQKPVTFETERELVVTPAKLDSLFIKFGARDQYKDLGPVLPSPSDAPAVIPSDAIALTAAGALPIPHVFYIAVPVNASWPKIDQLRLRFALEATADAMADPRSLGWEMPTVDDPPRAAKKPSASPATAPQTPAKMALIPQQDDTKNLLQSGDVVFVNPPLAAPVALDGIAGCWLGCRLLTPITCGQRDGEGMVRASQLPAVQQVTCEVELARQALAIDQAFFNGQKLDLSKDFFPFGERPKFGDVLYLASREVFSDPDATITMHVEMTNSESGADVGIPTGRVHNTQLSWEFWDGEAWTKLMGARLTRIEGAPAEKVVDETNSLTQNGDVKFKFPAPSQESIVNGQKNYWIRVRIAAGNYGEEARAAGTVVQPATLAPPSIKSIEVGYVVKKEAPPRAVLTYNDFVYRQQDSQQPFKPFVPLDQESAGTPVYFGFVVDPPLATGQPANSGAGAEGQAEQGRFPNQAVTAYLAAGDPASEKSGAGEEATIANWDYWNGAAWKKLSVHDETRSLRRTGLIQFIPPPDFVARKEFGRHRYWLRMRPNADNFAATVRHVFLNTTMAVQGISVVSDVLGSSNGKPNQKFQTTQAMVLSGQNLEVREPTLPPAHERKIVQAEEGNDAIEKVKDAASRADHFWVTWHEVPNFYDSGPRDRHYILDHVKGEVMFGDGTSGVIPPALPGNIRMRRYRSGGGVIGNQPPLAVTKLVSAVPYIQKVVNWLPAAGGTDPEENAMLLERGPRGVRHSGRAVTREDFEDLAMLASRDVARARSVPLYDLSLPPDARRRQPGIISVMIVPSSAASRPIPSSELLDRVRAYLDERRLPTMDLVVVSPEYIRVDVYAEIAVKQPGDANDVDVAVRQELESYLHPVNGGPDGKGWEFGRIPQEFDLNVRIGGIPGVSHIRDIRVSTVAARPGAERSGHFLICCGQHKIAIVLEEEESAAELAESR